MRISEKTNPAATGGEDSARLAAFGEHRGMLFSIAYRMLGSVTDAEDMLQETFIRWQQAGDDDIQSPRSYLVTIISRLCINQLQSARVQREEYFGQWLPEPVVTDPRSDPWGIVRTDESLSMAFLLLLERLTPLERAAFLLREVFEYEYSEIAAFVEQSEANCRQILRRARQHVCGARPRFAASAQKHSELLQGFSNAIATGSLDALLSLLAQDVVLYSDGGGKAAAVPNEVRGAGNVSRGIFGGFAKFVPKNLVRRMAQINGTQGIVSYFNGKPYSAVSLEVADGHICAIYVVTNPDKLAHLPGLSEI